MLFLFFGFLNLHFITSFFSFPINTTSDHLCSYDQSHALLDFKNSISINSKPSYYHCSSFPKKTNSWHEGQDCCNWDGVTCDITTGQVIGLDLSCRWLQGQLSSNNSLFLLQQLEILNLSYNNFTGSEIPPRFRQFQRLRSLNLSYSNFLGEVPIQISYLSNLVSLDLSSFYWSDLKLPRLTMKNLVQNLTMLKELNFGHVDSSLVQPDCLRNISSSLTSLVLYDLRGIFPTSIFHLPNLQLFYLFSSPTFSTNQTSNLADLPNLQVSLPTSNWNSTSLMELWFIKVDLKNGLPSSIGNLKSLKSLSIRDSKISGPIPDSIGNLTNLEYLSLDRNYLLGTIPPSIAYLTRLEYLDLGNNNLVGTIPPSIAYLTRLQHLYLISNKLVGSIPNFSNLSLLHTLDLWWNSLSGTIPLYMYSFPLLRELYLSYNQFIGGQLHPFQSRVVEYIYLSGCGLQGPIPTILFPYGANQLKSLGLSGNSLNRTIPSSLFTLPSLLWLDLQYNQLVGGIPEFKSTSLQIIDLSHNKLQGDIPILICNEGSIRVLDLSRNYFSGTIPECLGNMSTFDVLDLSMNKFHGKILNFAGHENRRLKTLKLNGNQLEGNLPVSLVNCRNLEVLDIGNNNIYDTFPHWLRFLTQLKVLVLKSNHFHGYIHDYKYQHIFQRLRIFDISDNNFVGSLPAKYIKGLEAMKKDMLVRTNDLMYMELYYGSGVIKYYHDSISLTIKGSEIQLEKILTTLMTIDFSKNKFRGGIPRVIGTLISLKSLNFSHNNLFGHIPSSIGNLRNLESLDLSSNKLDGTIPTKLASLTFLGKLNLSQNALVGPIPSTNNFDSHFDNTSYQGNLALCGPPLSKTCGPKKSPPIIYEEDGSNDDDFGRKIILYGYVSGLVIGLSIGYIVLSGELPIWFAKMVQRYRLRKLQGQTQLPR